MVGTPSSSHSFVWGYGPGCFFGFCGSDEVSFGGGGFSLLCVFFGFFFFFFLFLLIPFIW